MLLRNIFNIFKDQFVWLFDKIIMNNDIDLKFDKFLLDKYKL